jgi:hypothetical protein
MTRITHGNTCRRRRTVRSATSSAITTVIVTALIATMPACVSTDHPTAVINEDTELVGLWRGDVRGPYGGSVLTLRLRADSTMSADNDNPKYSRFDGVWTVHDGRFTATGNPSDGVVVTLVANAPFVRLRGTWTSNASSGTFDLAKR